MQKSQSDIRKFLERHQIHPIGDFQPITNSASQRQYFRVKTDQGSVIVMHSQNIQENETFIYFTQCMQQIQIPVAQILAVSQDKSMYVLQDLGDENLLTKIQTNDEKLSFYIESAIRDLVQMQIELPKFLDFRKTYEFTACNEKLILNDLFYFKNYFLEYLEIPFPKQALIEDFYTLAQNIQSLPNDFFMYRDFQSRNIMIFETKNYYIDYQGGMKGIAAYDCVSFSWQAKAQFSTEKKEKIKNLYFDNMQQHSTISLSDLEKSYRLSLILRLFQLLGAYGFRGLVQGKAHFRDSITDTLQNIDTIQKQGLLQDYPTLSALSQNYLQADKLYL